MDRVEADPATTPRTNRCIPQISCKVCVGLGLRMPLSGETRTGDHTTESTCTTTTYTLVEMLIDSTLTKLNSNSTHASPGVGVIQPTMVVEDTTRPTTSNRDIQIVRASKGRWEVLGRPTTRPSSFTDSYGWAGLLQLQFTMACPEFEPTMVVEDTTRPTTSNRDIQIVPASKGRCEVLGRPTTGPSSFPISYGGADFVQLLPTIACQVPLRSSGVWVRKGSGRPTTDPPHPPASNIDYMPVRVSKGRCDVLGRPTTRPSPFPDSYGGAGRLQLQLTMAGPMPTC